MMGSKSTEALRGQKTIFYQDQQVLLRARERDTQFFGSKTHSVLEFTHYTS